MRSDDLSRDDLLQMLANPRLLNFLEAVRLEAVHQPAVWGDIHSQMQHPAEWPNLITYLLGKVVQADMQSDSTAYLTNIVAIAAACYHWHEYLMRVPAIVDAAAGSGDGRVSDALDRVGDARQTLADVALQMLTNEAIRSAAGDVVASNWEMDTMRSEAMNRLGSRDNEEDG